MLNWLKNLFYGPNKDSLVDASANAVLVFMRSVKSQIDQRDFMIPNHHTLIYCYAYGALNIETNKHNLDETAQIAALLLLIANLSDLSPEDISGLLNKCIQTLQEQEGQDYLRDGAEHYSRWLEADPSVVALLGKRLEAREKDMVKANRTAIYP